MTHGTTDLTIRMYGHELRLAEVPYTLEVDTDAGLWAYPNGDPGHPPTISADITLDWSREEAVESVEAFFGERGRTVPKWVRRQAEAIQDAITEELNRLLWEGRI